MRPTVPFHAPVAFLRGRAQVLAQRAAADLALHAAAKHAGAPARFLRDERGAPRPNADWHWSTAHTSGLAAAAIAPGPIGIDVERLGRPRLDAARTQLRDELSELGASDDFTVLSLWCAKEAVVKRAGLGVAGLPRCRVLERVGKRWHLLLDETREDVTVFVEGEHLIAVAAGTLEVLRPAAARPHEVSA